MNKKFYLIITLVGIFLILGILTIFPALIKNSNNTLENVRNKTGYTISSLINLSVEIPPEKKWVISGELIKADIEVNTQENFSEFFIRHWIIDKESNIISEIRETRTPNQLGKFQIEMPLPSNLKSGLYRFYTKINYNQNKKIFRGDYFEVVTSKFEMLLRELFSIPYLFIPISIILILMFIAIKKEHKRKVKLRNRKRKKKSR